jgi:hypothetical protein
MAAAAEGNEEELDLLSSGHLHLIPFAQKKRTVRRS